MNGETVSVWEFGKFRLDVRRKVLRHGEETISMPLKELEILSLLVKGGGELVTKDELISEVWGESFVEESNLTRHIYLLRKTLNEFGADGVIENVPRRGYRFTAAAKAVDSDEIVVERTKHTRTSIEIQEADGRRLRSPVTFRFIAYASVALIIGALSAAAGYRFLAANSSHREIRSLAVLPFKAMGEGADPKFNGVALADILTTRLSSLRTVKVRSSVASTEKQGVDASNAGPALGVDAVLDGTLYYLNNRVRVTARLIDTSDSSIIWSGDFERPSRDELYLHSDIAQQIVPLIASQISAEEREALSRNYTKNQNAYELYLIGRQEWNKRNNAGVVEAERLFRTAIQQDPSFALAYVGLADSLLFRPSDANEARVCIEKALELDPDLGEAYASRGFFLMFWAWRWSEAETAFKRSIELNPNYATAHHWYATLLALRGDFEGAKAEMNAALEIHPNSHNLIADLGQIYYFAGDYARAENFCRKALEIYPDFSFAHSYLYWIYLKTGRYEEALREIAYADQSSSRFASNDADATDPYSVYLDEFRKSGLRGYLYYRLPENPTDPENFYSYAAKHSILGDNDRAIEFLRQSIKAKKFMSAFAKADPVFEALRSDQRYQDLIRELGLS